MLQIPDDLTDFDQWVLWRHVRGTKIPYTVTGRPASTTNLADWSEFSTVSATLDQFPKRYAGIGFVFSEADPFVGIDLDDCLDAAGEVIRWALPLVARFADTYMEISPSGSGIKIFCRGKLPAAVGKVAVEAGGIEIYDHARYFTVTGRAFNGAPLQIEDHAADVQLLYERLAGRRTGVAHKISPNGRIPKGTQHLSLVSLAGTLRRRGVCEQAIEACLQAVNRHQCEQPGPPENISRIIASSRPWGDS